MATLAGILDRLEAEGGKVKPPRTSDPFEMVLWENVAYLVNDDKREHAFRALLEEVGAEPDAILGAPYEVLRQVVESAGGPMADNGVEKLRRCAEIAAREFPKGLRPVLKLPLPAAKKALRRFPGIGEPGAEKILLFTKTLPVLALESNGLRVLTRLGYGTAQKDYAATYRSARAALQDELKEDCAWLIRAHQLLRRHGQDVCKTSRPRCDACAVTASCRYYREEVKRPGEDRP
jgi:endonuclease III